jgi:hypothetical protein
VVQYIPVKILEATFMFITRFCRIENLTGKVWVCFILDLHRIFHVAVARSPVTDPYPEPVESIPDH